MGMQNTMQERALAESGELRQGSNMGGGQMLSADFVLTPAVVFQEDNAGGFGGYGNTNEGKVIAASLMDHYNNVVKSVRGQASRHRDVDPRSGERPVQGPSVPADRHPRLSSSA